MTEAQVIVTLTLDEAYRLWCELRDSDDGKMKELAEQLREFGGWSW